MSEIFTVDRRVEFCETDMAGIVHFSAYACYMEQAEHALWRSLGSSVVQELEPDVHLSWPRVHIECDFQGSAKFEDVLQISLQVLKLGTKSIEFGFAFKCDGKQIATGRVVTVCCRVAKARPLQSIPIPDELRDKLSRYLADSAGITST